MNSQERMALLGSRWDCKCGASHEVPVRRVLIGKGVLEDVPALIRELGFTGRAFLLADEITSEVAGRRVESRLTRANIIVHANVLPGKPRADDITAEAVASAVSSSDSIVISCGSGTITDLAKWAAFRHSLPHIAIATAPSMNGYASGIVALTKCGLKTTDAVLPPMAVIADTDILCEAPIEMIRAGLGDLLSKPVCNADWKLASIIKAEHFCKMPFELIKDLENIYMHDASAIGRRDPKAIALLTEALVFSGISMVIAGSSAPASGGEHLISHFLDMRRDIEGCEHDLHGAQVGVASLATARFYERIMETDKRDIDPAMISSAWERSEALAARVHKIFGKQADLILAEFAKKRMTRSQYEAQVRDIAARWDDIRAAVRPFLMKSSQIHETLDSAGAKVHYSKLGTSAAEFSDALELAMCIRNRYTVLDLAFAVGRLDAWTDEIVASR